MERHGTRGFTLIELLIVIAIIAILALIAIPNFIEAQTRAKVSRVQADMRSLAVALEAYYVDHNAYPRAMAASDFSRGYWAFYLWFDSPNAQARNISLTTPIAYIGGFPVDPFQPEVGVEPVNRNYSYFYYNFLGVAEVFRRDPDEWNKQYEGQNFSGPTTLEAPAPLKFNTGWTSGAPDTTGKIYYCNWALMSLGPDRLHDLVPYNGTRQFINTVAGWRWATNGAASFYDPTNGTVSAGDIWRLSAQ